VGGHISRGKSDKGNIFTVPSNSYAEFNMFLDPLAAKTVLESGLNITLIPLATQREFSFQAMLNRLYSSTKTPEARFVKRLLTRLQALHQKQRRYMHMVKPTLVILFHRKTNMILALIVFKHAKTEKHSRPSASFQTNPTLLLQDMFLGEILGAIFLGGDHALLKPKMRTEYIKVIAEGDESKDGHILIDKLRGKQIKILERVDLRGCYESFASRLDDKKQSAVIGSFEEQRMKWNTPPSYKPITARIFH